jgi:hypothetical protein
MIRIVLLSLLLIAFFIFRKNTGVKIKRNVLTTQECNKIIDISNKYEYEQFPEEVDLKAAYEIDIYDVEQPNAILNEELWDICKNIYESHMKKDFPMPGYVFLRRYTPNERIDLPIHLDENKFTMSFLLSPRNMYNGGDLYVFDKKETMKYKYINYGHPDIKNKFVESYKKLPIINYDQGDAVLYSGKEHLHGVLPVTEGTRYTLSFFFE